MEYQESPTRPLSRGMTALLVLVVLTAFLPHRERALLLTQDGFGTMLASQALENSSFAAPTRWGLLDGLGWRWQPLETGPTRLRRERSGPGRERLAGALPSNLPATSFGSTVPTIIPLGRDLPQGAPVLASTLPTAGGPGPGGISPFGSLPGGGGGGSISGPVDPIVPPSPVPPTAVVPEPATWAFMILGFGLIGSALRRSSRRIRTAASVTR